MGGAKADRRKEAAIATAVENFMNEILAEKDDGRMTRAKMVQEPVCQVFFSSSHINFDKVYHIKLTKKSSSTFAFQDFCQSSSTW